MAISPKSGKKYWGDAIRSPGEFLHLLEEKYSFIARIKAVYAPALQPLASVGRVLEIGIGLLGLGVATLLEPHSKWKVTGVDPLPRVDSVEIPEYLAQCYDVLKKRPLNYIQGPAEEFNTGKDSIDLAICYGELIQMLNKAGLEIVWYPRKSREPLRRLFGRGKRDLPLITRKPS
jgi:hypothetical protein